MAKAIHGDPKIDEEGQALVKSLGRWARHDRLANLNLQILIRLERYASSLASRCRRYIDARLAQSSLERDRLSRPNTA